MANTSVSGVESLFGGLDAVVQAQMAGRITNNISANVGDASESFANVLGKQNAANMDIADSSKANEASKNPAQKKDTSDRIAGEDGAGARKTTATENKQENKTEAADSKKAEESVSKADEAKGDELSQEEIEEVSEVISAVANQFAAEVAQILGISPEEMNNLLEDMGISAEQLLDKDTLNAFALQVMGVEDSLTLLTDETKYEQVQDLNAALEELLNSDSDIEGINVGELLEKVQEAVNVNAQEKVNLTDESKNVDAGNKNEGDAELASDMSQVTLSDGQTLGAQAMLKNSKRESGEADSNADKNAMQDFGNPVQNVQQDFEAQIKETAGMQNNAEALNQAQDIANQIMDYMRAQVKPDMQTLEMQLHPASLGNIQISLTNKDGSLTASFVAQDEQVKAVLEGQMIQLQERFEEQGIKVNSIEVSVGTYSFDQGLSQQQSNESQAEEENKPKRVRRLQIGNDFGIDDIEALDEEDRLAAEMMAANGGTVDLQA